MKKVMFLLCAAAFLAVSCDKELDPTPADPEYPPTADVIYNAVTDIDGNSYDAVRIGEQVWMASNLRTTRYANGDAIPEGQTTSYIEPYRYTPSTNVAEYGYLYNWAAVMHGASSSTANPSGVQGVCPTGWHVPSDAEWTQLTDYVSSQSEYVCGSDNTIAKALAGATGWSSSTNTCAVGNTPSQNNSTGFSALPAGAYSGNYHSFGNYAYFWSATESYSDGAYGRYLYYYYATVTRFNIYKYHGFSVRCVRD